MEGSEHWIVKPHIALKFSGDLHSSCISEVSLGKELSTSRQTGWLVQPSADVTAPKSPTAGRGACPRCPSLDQIDAIAPPRRCTEKTGSAENEAKGSQEH